ncbi:hypothetical protein ACJJTC_006494 [Scirpophaga incertulas]
MLWKMVGKWPSGAKVAPEQQILNTKREERKDPKRKWERCEDKCPGDPWAYCIVLWCACAMSLISSGYSLYKQQGLQDRLATLEEQHYALRSVVLEPQQPLVERLRREILMRPPPSYWRPKRSIRDYGDCVCPPVLRLLMEPEYIDQFKFITHFAYKSHCLPTELILKRIGFFSENMVQILSVIRIRGEFNIRTLPKDNHLKKAIKFFRAPRPQYEVNPELKAVN